eukprot:jgi/Mesvir1/9719/Mv12190-RA.1
MGFGVATLEEAIAMPDVSLGVNDWYNVSTPIRRAIEAMRAVIVSQDATIKMLAENLKGVHTRLHHVELEGAKLGASAAAAVETMVANQVDAAFLGHPVLKRMRQEQEEAAASTKKQAVADASATVDAMQQQLLRSLPDKVEAAVASSATLRRVKQEAETLLGSCRTAATQAAAADMLVFRDRLLQSIPDKVEDAVASSATLRRMTQESEAATDSLRASLARSVTEDMRALREEVFHTLPAKVEEALGGSPVLKRLETRLEDVRDASTREREVVAAQLPALVDAAKAEVLQRVDAKMASQAKLLRAEHTEALSVKLDAVKMEEYVEQVTTVFEKVAAHNRETAVQQLQQHVSSLNDDAATKAATAARMAEVEARLSVAEETARKCLKLMHRKLPEADKRMADVEARLSLTESTMASQQDTLEQALTSALAAAEKASQDLAATTLNDSRMAKLELEKLERKLADLQRHAADTAVDLEKHKRVVEGVRETQEELVAATYKRVDEHAASIKGLSDIIAANLGDRPTLGVVRRMLEEQHKAARQATEAAIEPLARQLVEMEAKVAQLLAKARVALEQGTDAQGQAVKMAMDPFARRLLLVEDRLRALEPDGPRTPSSQATSAADHDVSMGGGGSLSSSLVAARSELAQLGEGHRKVAKHQAAMANNLRQVAEELEAANHRLSVLDGQVAALVQENQDREATTSEALEPLASEQSRLATAINAASVVLEDHGRRLGAVERDTARVASLDWQGLA